MGDHRLQRKIALEGHRFTAQEAFDAGLLDHLVNGKTVDVLAKAEEVADNFSGNARGGVWGLIKVCIFFFGSMDLVNMIAVGFIPRYTGGYG